MEVHTGFRVEEHRPEHYDAHFHQLFSDAFLLAHRDFMEYVLDGYAKSDAGERLALLMDFRKKMIPREALEVAELGRFNIPPGSALSTRAQLYHGLMILVQQRPAKVFYLMAPRPQDLNRPANTFPRTEIVFAQPGFEWLRRAVEEVIAEENAGLAEHQEPKRDLLRESYEEISFEVVKTYPHCFGTPNGCHVMRTSRERLMDKLIGYQLENQRYLTPDQLATLRVFAK